MADKEIGQKAVITGTKGAERQETLQFIPKLKGRKIIIRLISGGQPVTGIIEGYNLYEILLLTAKGKLLVFKHAIATIKMVDEPKGYKTEI
ncbi:MAG: hypothetical protein HGA93_00050 [Methanothrix sp.]|nr:hypothetical protein [Methanothrix sp.]